MSPRFHDDDLLNAFFGDDDELEWSEAIALQRGMPRHEILHKKLRTVHDLALLDRCKPLGRSAAEQGECHGHGHDRR